MEGCIPSVLASAERERATISGSQPELGHDPQVHPFASAPLFVTEQDILALREKVGTVNTTPPRTSWNRRGRWRFSTPRTLDGHVAQRAFTCTQSSYTRKLRRAAKRRGRTRRARRRSPAECQLRRRCCGRGAKATLGVMRSRSLCEYVWQLCRVGRRRLDRLVGSWQRRRAAPPESTSSKSLGRSAIARLARRRLDRDDGCCRRAHLARWLRGSGRRLPPGLPRRLADGSIHLR